MAHIEFFVWVFGTELCSILSTYVRGKTGQQFDPDKTSVQVAAAVVLTIRVTVAAFLW